MFDDHFLLGYVSGTHGLNGELKIRLDVDHPEYYREMESVFLRQGDKLIPFFVESIQVGAKGKAILALEDVQTFEEATELKGTELYLPLELLPDLGEGNFYYHEVIGFEAEDEHGDKIGTIRDCYTDLAQPLFAIDGQGRELLVPIVDDFISEVNKEKKYIRLKLPDGYREIYLGDAH